MNTIDTRDLQERLDELESLRDAVTEAQDELTEAGIPAGTMRSEIPADFLPLIEALDAAKDEFGEDEQEELAELENLASEISEFRHGEQMIPVRDFEEYAQELAEEIGAIPRDTAWPCTCIDWEQAARELKMDYTEVTYQGEDYYVRA